MIEKVAKALKEEEETDKKMKEIMKRLKEVFNFRMPVSDEELNRRIIEDINRYRERSDSSSNRGRVSNNMFNVYADIQRNSGIRQEFVSRYRDNIARTNRAPNLI